MARRKKKKSSNRGDAFASKYDIPGIIMEYVAELMPDPDGPELLEKTAEEGMELFENMTGLCISIWNYAAMPPDCAISYLDNLSSTLEAEKGKAVRDNIINVMLEISKDMKKHFPNPDAVIIDHEFTLTANEQLDFAIELLPVDEAIAIAREDMENK